MTDFGFAAETTGADRARYLILCFDGTGNIWGNGHDSNVVKIARLFVKDPQQLVYYDPGVGTTDTFPAIGLLERVIGYARRLIGLALAGGIYQNIGAGYQFLIENYRAGDRICLYGFSRGAFTARSVAGIVDQFGIVQPSARPLIPLIVRTYFARPNARGARPEKTRAGVASDIRENFTSPAGRSAPVYFLGVWDTVASVGLFGLKITTDTDVRQKRYHHVRHAVALEEQRWKYSPRLYTDSGIAPPGQTFEQWWFTGCHSDVGGSYPDSGLSDITLRWMLDESGAAGLRFSAAAAAVHGDPSGLAHDEAYTSPGWLFAGLCRRFRPADAPLHPSVALRRGDNSVWKPLLRRRLFWSLALLCGAVAALPAALLARGSAAFWASFGQALHFQVCPSSYLSTPGAFPGGGTRATWLDFPFMALYLPLLALLIVHARRRLGYAPQNRLAAKADALSGVGLPLAVALADLAENVSVLIALGASGPGLNRWIGVVDTCTRIKLVGVALLVLYFIVVRFVSRGALITQAPAAAGNAG